MANDLYNAIAAIKIALEHAPDIHERKQIVREVLNEITTEFGDELLEVVDELR